MVLTAVSHRDPCRHDHRVRHLGIASLPLGSRLMVANDARSSWRSVKEAETDPSSGLGRDGGVAERPFQLGCLEGGLLLDERDSDDLARPVAMSDRLARKSTRLNSSHVAISYAVFCL